MAFDDLVALETAIAGDDDAAILNRCQAKRLNPVLETLQAQLDLKTLTHPLPHEFNMFSTSVFCFFCFLRGHAFFPFCKLPREPGIGSEVLTSALSVRLAVSLSSFIRRQPSCTRGAHSPRIQLVTNNLGNDGRAPPPDHHQRPNHLFTRSGATGTPQNQSLLERTGPTANLSTRQAIRIRSRNLPRQTLLSYKENRPERATELEGSWKQKPAPGHTHRNSWNDFFSHWLHPGPNRRLNHTQHAFSDQEQSLKKIRRNVRRRH